MQGIVLLYKIENQFQFERVINFMRIKRKILVLVLALVAMMSLLAGCGSEKEDSGKLSIVCSVYPAYDFIMNIVGENSDNIEVTYLLEKGVDMHNFQPTAEDIITITQSDLMVYVGGESDSSIKDVLATVNTNAVPLLSLVELREEELLPGMTSDHDHEYEDDYHKHAAEYDEHVWLSVKNSIGIVEKLCEAVSAIDPDNADVYAANAEEYINTLVALDKKYEDMVSKAVRNVVLVADRFPFAYLADDYGLTCYAAFPGCSAETEAGFETVVFLAEKIKEHKLSSIFILENSDGAVADTVAVAAEVSDLKIGVLDSMQSVSRTQIDNGYSYIVAMEKNLLALTEALN